MNRAKFWTLIDEAIDGTPGRVENTYERLVERLSQLPEEEILQWYLIFEAYQSLSYKEKLWAAAYVIGGGCSDDGFDYFRAWLTAQGKWIFLRALQDPETLAELEVEEGCAEFEEMLGAAIQAYFRKTGGKVDYEAFFARAHEVSLPQSELEEMAAEIVYAQDIDEDWDDEDLPELLPALWAKYGDEDDEDNVTGEETEGRSLAEMVAHWHNNNDHKAIIAAITALPEDQWDYDITCWLARAYNNLDDRHYEQALELLDRVRKEGFDDPYWHFRYGYALYYMDEDLEAAAYFGRSIELGEAYRERSEYDTTVELWEEALRYAEPGQEPKPEGTRMFIYRDSKSNKFWGISCRGNEFCANYGKTGTAGRFDIKEFDSEEACRKEAEKQIASKLKKGYLEVETVPRGKLYIDNDDIGPHPLTSHPVFREYFTDEIYYNCFDEEAPFGSDEGSDVLAELEDYIKKNKDIDIVEFPCRVMTVVWGMEYYPPDSLEAEDIDALLARPKEGIPMSQMLIINDQVIIAAAFGQIKIMGKVALRLRDMALRSMERLQIVAQKEGYGFSETTAQLKKDLESFEMPRHKPSLLAAQIMEYMGCPCQNFGGMLDDDDIIYSYQKAAEEGKTQGYTPLLLVADDTLLETMLDAADLDEFDAEKIAAYRRDTIAKAMTLNPKEILAELREELELDDKTADRKVTGGSGRDRITGFWDYGSQLTNEVILAKVPTRNPWELPIYAPMGGFNDCPPPEDQAAIMKYWHEKYGATPALVAYDVWEFLLPAPVADKKEAVALAEEQYLFCLDRIEQSAEGTIGRLAGSLMKSTAWYFWWD